MVRRRDGIINDMEVRTSEGWMFASMESDIVRQVDGDAGGDITTCVGWDGTIGDGLGRENTARRLELLWKGHRWEDTTEFDSVGESALEIVIWYVTWYGGVEKM